MRSDKLDKQIKGMVSRTSAHLDERVYTMLDQLEQGPPKLCRSDACPWRQIMQSPKMKCAAAAVVGMMIVLSIVMFDHSATPAYGLERAYALDQQVRTVHMKGVCTYDPSHDYPGQAPAVVPIEHWLDFERGRMRRKTLGWGFGTKDGYTVDEYVNNGHYTMNIDHTEETVVFKTWRDTDFRRGLLVQRSKIAMLEWVYSDVDQLDEFQCVGEEDINGKTYQIWERIGSSKIKIWQCPETGEIARYKRWSGRRGDDWTTCYDMHTIERNIDIPENTFDMVPPENYTLKNTLDTAGEADIFNGASVTMESEEETVTFKAKILFTLTDGSLILAWNSQSSKNSDSQAALFAPLVLGGVLPKLPVEVHELKPVGHDTIQAGQYVGYHLTYTMTQDTFYEWSLYVPDFPLPSAKVEAYGISTRSHGSKARPRVTIQPDVEIAGPESFDLFVHGALAELSDEGLVSKDITYDSVLQLAAELRKSLASK